MKKLLAGIVVIGLLATANIFAMMHQQDNIQLEAAPPITEIAFLSCAGAPTLLDVTPGITTVLDGETCAEALQMLMANDGLVINESLSNHVAVGSISEWVLMSAK